MSCLKNCTDVPRASPVRARIVTVTSYLSRRSCKTRRGGAMMTKRSLRSMFPIAMLASTLALSARAYLQEQLPTGQYVTPTVIPNAVQQYLNPQLAAYPDFIAGEAVRS